ncbi:MAG: CopD family protein [Gammaproteobacteria bacterium]
MDVMTVPSAWELASLVSKLLIYFGAASALGGGVCLLLYRDGSRHSATGILSYQLIGGLFGFQGVILGFLVQVGMINDSGLAGAFDWDMAQILLDTPAGDLGLFRSLGFIVIVLSSAFFLQRCRVLSSAPDSFFYQRNFSLCMLGFLLFVYSYRFGGHVSVLGAVEKLALAIHLVAFAFWIGSLYPLYRIAGADDVDGLRLSLKRFGDHAIVFVSLLAISGLLMALGLVHSFAEMVQTGYGRILSLKLLLVLFLLGIAARNRLVLVPKMTDPRNANRFRKSVRMAIGLATVILLVTAYLSTLVGPMDHSM